MPTELIPLSKLIADPDCQPPDRISAETADEYLQAMLTGATFPPVSATFDGDAYWLWDGFHRLQAIQRMGRAVIEVDWQPGGRLDAIEAACGANATHGLKRSNTEKRWSVETMFQVMAKRGENWSDPVIASKCGVHQTTVMRLRPEIEAAYAMHSLQRRTGADGKNYPATATGKTKREPVRVLGAARTPPQPLPEAAVRVLEEIARRNRVPDEALVFRNVSRMVSVTKYDAASMAEVVVSNASPGSVEDFVRRAPAFAEWVLRLAAELDRGSKTPLRLVQPG